jgi:hypothetical protein
LGGERMTLMQRRSALMAAGKKSRLPAEYQEVEWIGCSGDQYIQTNYIIGTPTTILCKTGFMTQNAGTVDRPIVWIRNLDKATNPQTTYKFPNIYNGKIEIAGYGINNTNAFSAQDDEKIEMEFDYHDGNQIIRRNGASDLTYSNAKPTQASTKPIRIFWSDKYNTSSESNQSKFSGRLYYFYFRQDNVEVFDMIPCYRKSDGEIGMYDIVSNTFFTNAGTGTFTKGGNV